MILTINPSLPDIICPHCKTGLDIEFTYEEADSEIRGGKVSCPYCDKDFVLEVIPQSYKAVLTDPSGAQPGPGKE